jgi:hypothetical protein
MKSIKELREILKNNLIKREFKEKTNKLLIYLNLKTQILNKIKEKFKLCNNKANLI